MKSITKGVTLFALGVWLAACQTGGVANKSVQDAFAHKFTQAKDVKWSHNTDYSYAHFDQNGKSVVAVFGNDGQYVATDVATPEN